MRSAEHRVVCPTCGYNAERSSNLHDDGTVPVDGDIAMCLGCGTFLIYEAALADGLRMPRGTELADIVLDPDCRAMHRVWKETVAVRKRRLQ